MPCYKKYSSHWLLLGAGDGSVVMCSVCIGGSCVFGCASRLALAALLYLRLLRERVLYEWVGVTRWYVDCGGPTIGGLA